MLRSLTVERETIGNCMFWCLSHADAAQEVLLLTHCQNSEVIRKMQTKSFNLSSTRVIYHLHTINT